MPLPASKYNPNEQIGSKNSPKCCLHSSQKCTWPYGVFECFECTKYEYSLSITKALT